MKKILLITVLAFACNSLNQYKPQNPLEDTIDRWMIGLYPEWWDWSQKERDVIKMMFERSTDKHWWFPDLFKEKGVELNPKNSTP
jgi:hypothetical protein